MNKIILQCNLLMWQIIMASFSEALKLTRLVTNTVFNSVLFTQLEVKTKKYSPPEMLILMMMAPLMNSENLIHI